MSSKTPQTPTDEEAATASAVADPDRRETGRRSAAADPRRQELPGGSSLAEGRRSGPGTAAAGVTAPPREAATASIPLEGSLLAHRPRRRWWPWVAALAGAAVVIYLLFGRGGQGAATAGKGAGTQPPPVLVAAVPAGTKDVGVYLTGLGTVNAVSTVTVRSRVDGQLINVAFHEGQVVRAGDLLAQIDPRPFQVQLMQAEGQMAKDQAALKNANLDLQRYKILFAEDSIPRQQLDTQMATVNQFEAALKSDQAQIESAKLNLAYSRITAPTSGRIGLRLVDPGNIVHASDANGLLVITQLQPVAVVFTIPADSLPQVQRQMQAGKGLPVDAYDRDLKNKLASGSLLAVDNQIDQTTGTVRLKAIFPNQDNALFSNQFVNARLLVDTLRGAVTVPTAAVQTSPQSTFVYHVKPDQTVEARDVVVRLTEGDDAAIASGLAPGELVVVDGIDKLRPGSKVTVEQAGAGGAGAAAGRGARRGTAGGAPAGRAGRGGAGRGAGTSKGGPGAAAGQGGPA
jgi:membrane fusion protein, multidrug efflux system